MQEVTKQHNAECTADAHNEHLCYLMCDGFHYSHKEQYKVMVQDANFRCQYCARTAKRAENLCAPIPL